MQISLHRTLLTAEIALTNALADPEVLQSLSRYGYDEARLQEGAALYAEAQARQQEHLATYGRRVAGTDAFHRTWQAAQSLHRFHVKVGREAFKRDREALRALGLTGECPKRFSAWVQRAQTFYALAAENPHFGEQLAHYGVSARKIQEGRTLVEKVLAAKAAQELQHGQALVSTQARDAQVTKLHKWLVAFTKIARVALAGNRRALAKLGLVKPARPQTVVVDEEVQG